MKKQELEEKCGNLNSIKVDIPIKCQSWCDDCKSFDRSYCKKKYHEVWIPVEGYEESYEVSNYGRVRSVKRDTGNQFSEGMIRKQRYDKYGYLVVGLVKNNNSKPFTVHRLLAKAFLNTDADHNQVNHKDGKKDNNHFLNLEWCNSFQNQSHRFNELGHVGHSRKLTKEQCFNIYLSLIHI